MIEKYLIRHITLGKLHGAYLVSTDDLNNALSEVESFAKNNLFCGKEVSFNADYQCVKRKDNKTKNIAIDQIRDLQNFLYKTSVITGYKVGVIYGADEMNLNASNSCLKILEEPPSNTHLFLITNNAASILPTIRSRCAKISYNYHLKDSTLDKENMVKHCLKSQTIKERINFIAKFASKDRDIWLDFVKNVENILVKCGKKSIGIDVDFSVNELDFYNQLRSHSPSYIQKKYEEVTEIIDNVNNYDLDLRSNVILLLDKLRY